MNPFFTLALTPLLLAIVLVDGADPENAAPIIARMGETPIRMSQIGKGVPGQLQYFAQRRRAALESELQQRIDTELFQQEARRRFIDVRRLLEEEVESGLSYPPEEEISQTHKTSSLAGIPLDQVRPRIVEELRRPARERRTAEYAGELRAQVDVEVHTELLKREEGLVELDDDTLIARVGDTKILLGELYQGSSTARYQIDLEADRLLRDELDVFINKRLLAQRAEELGLTQEQVLERFAHRRVKLPTKEQARAFYDKNRARIPDEYGPSEDSILALLMRETIFDSEIQFANELRNHAQIEILLEEPVEPSYSFDLSGRAVFGNPNAPIVLTLVEDFACSLCADTRTLLEELQQEYPEALRIVPVYLPLSVHPSSFQAAVAAEASRDFGLYQEYTEFLFQRPKGLGEEALLEYAEWLGIDRVAFRQHLQLPEHETAVTADKQLCLKYMFTSTPQVLIDGVRTKSLDAEDIRKAVQHRIGKLVISHDAR